MKTWSIWPATLPLLALPAIVVWLVLLRFAPRWAVPAAVVATVLTPVLMPGMPVLVAAVVAIVVGWTNWLGASATPPPVLGEAPAPRRPEGPGQGT